jgi:gluconate 2-dehydrogenase gamma chain
VTSRFTGPRPIKSRADWRLAGQSRLQRASHVEKAMESRETEGHSVALIFFNDFEARTVEAIAERIIPGGDGDIGATDAGVVYYIDRAVAGFSVSLQKVYRLGLRELEAFCRKSGKSFIGLSGERQDEVVRRFLGPESRDAAAAHRSAGEDDHDFGSEHEPGRALDKTLLERLFAVVREHAIEGLFCDPVYGGNRNTVGWRLVGFPGVHWGYTAEQMKEGYDGRQLPIRTLDDLRRELKSPPDNAVFMSNGRR